MSDQHYRLIVDMETRGSLAPQLEKLGKSGNDLSKIKDVLGTIGSGLGSVAGGLAGAFTGAVEAVGGIAAGLAKVGAVATGGALTYGVVVLNNELEQTRMSLGAIFNAQMGGGMTSNLSLASTTIKDMRRDAAMLPGEFKDLLGFMRLGATPGLQAGASVPQLEKLSANAMAAAAATGVQMDQASREFAMLLQGRAGAHNVFGSMLGFSGDKAQSFNASTGDQRLKLVEAALKKYEPAIEEFSKTFDALSSTMKDNAKNVLQKATSGVFDHVKAAMGDANKWYDAHEGQVTAFAEKVGDKLVYAFEWGRQKIRDWYPAVQTFAENAYAEIASVWQRIGPMVEKVGAMLKSALSDPKTFDRLEGVLKMYAAVKIGSMVAPAAGGMFSGITSMLGGGGIGGGAAGVAELGMAAGVAAAAVAVIGTTIYGVVDVLTDTSNMYHDGAVKNVDEMKSHLASIGKNVEASGIGGMFKWVADSAGAVALFMGNSMLLQLDELTKAFAWATTGIGDFYRSVNTFLGLANPTTNDPPKHDANNPWKDAKEIFREERDDRANQKASTKSVTGGGGTNIQKVEIVVTSNQDPERIARITLDKLKDLSRNPTSSRYAPTLMGR